MKNLLLTSPVAMDSGPSSVTAERLAAAPSLGRFAVLEMAGEGAMGVVYAAFDRTLNRRVALKVLRGEANRGHMRERARREALAMARVNHPNVAAIYEVGEAEGRLFFAMEFVAGPTLKDWLGDGSRGWSERLAMLCGAGRGLAAAHASGLVHRDFKPHNVLIGEDGRPRVIDFGPARDPALSEAPLPVHPPAEADEPLQSALTRAGDVMGTPAYMAPEVADGASATPLSDQFAFCVATFEAIYGQPPFSRDSLLMMRHAIATGALDVPMASPVPPSVLAALQRGLAAEPDARWPSLDALLDVLEAEGPERVALRHAAQKRAAVALALILVVVPLTLKTLLDPHVPTPRAMVTMEFGVTCVLAMLAGWLWDRGTADAQIRRLAGLVLLFGLTKLAAAGVGARLGADTPQLFAIDTVVMAAFVSIAALLIPPVPRVTLVLLVVAVVGTCVWPAQALRLHHLAGLTATVLLANFSRRRHPRQPRVGPG